MEITPLEKALDLKSKVMVLLKACSDVSNYLSVKIDEIQKDSSRLSEITDAVAKARAENESLDKSFKAIKTEYELCKKATEEERRKATEIKESAHAESLAVMEQANAILSNAQAKEAETNAKLEEADKLRRDLESKLEKIASIGGK